jgi:hypothetical protein
MMPPTTIYRSDYYADRQLGLGGRGAPARRGAPLAVRGLDGECTRQATIVVPTMRPRPTARLRTATAMLYSARVADPGSATPTSRSS